MPLSFLPKHSGNNSGCPSEVRPLHAAKKERRHGRNIACHGGAHARCTGKPPPTVSVQELFAAWYRTDASGNIVSAYINGNEARIDPDERLTKWERNLRTRFANLEATLTKYNQINEDLKSQISSLKSSTSSS